VGINTSTPAAALDISGIVVFRNKVGFQNPNPVYSLDVAGSLYASEQIIGGKGTQSNPMYTFFDSPGSGMYIPVDPSYGTGSFAIAVNRAPAAIFSSNAVNFFQNLDVSGTFSARNIDISAFSVTNGTPGIPSVTFTNDTSTGLYLAASNRLGVTTGGFRRMEVLSNGDVSMGRLVTKDISYSGTIVGTDPNTCNVIGGVTLCNGNVILTGTATNSNLLVPGWIRNTTTAFVLDISSGNISNSLTTRSSNFRASAGTAGAPAYSFASDATTGVHSAGTSQLAFDTAGVQRMVISNGNVGIGKATPVVALEVVGDVSATTYNGPGGTQSAPHYTFSDDRTTGLFFPGANMIGLSAGGTERVRISNGNVGIGTTTPANALDVAGTLRVIGAAGDLTFTNGTISLAGVPVISSTGVLSNATNTSNSIGGVTLSNTNIAYAGTITGSTAGASNRIGGVTLSNTDITYAGAISNTVNTTSNTIGGVTLSNTVVRVGNGTDSVPTIAFSSDTDTGLYRFGAGTIGVVSGGNAVARLSTASSIFYTGALTTLTLSNRQLLAQNGTAAAPSHSFVVRPDMGLYLAAADQLGVSIGGVVRSTFSNGDFSNSGVTRSSNFLAAPGGAARPAYAFTTDPSSGLDLVGTSYLAFDTSGVQRMCISGDLVGIGTAAPAFTLDISSTGTYGLQIRNPAAAGNIGLRLSNGTGGEGHFGLSGGTDSWTPGTLAGDTVIRATCNFLINTKATTRMVIKDTGIGIGTTVPGQALDVVGPSDGDGKAVIQVKNSSTGQGIVRVVGSNQANTTGLELFHTGSYGGLYLPAGISNLSFWTAGARQMDIVNGRIGVGNATPSATLDLAAAGAWIAVNRNGNIPFVSDVSMIVEGGNGVGLYFQKGTNNNFCGISIKTLCNNVLAERFRVDANTGRIGIGTTAPSSLLHIQKSTNYDGGNSTDGTPYGIYFSAANNSDSARVLAVDRNTAGGAWKTELAFYTKYDVTSTERLRLSGEGNLGVGTSNPGYRLDVTAETTSAPAINMSTWTRSTGSTTMACIGSINRTGNVYNWSNATPSMNTNLISFVASNGTTGGYFSILKSGIWAIHVIAQGQDSGAALAIDASNNTGLNGVQGTTGTLSRASGFAGGTSFIGYLSSNANMFYKIIGVTFEATSKNTKLFISFLEELPDISPTFPPP
jgi:hypothetical protein